MHIPVPVTPLLRSVPDVLRTHQLQVDLHRAATPIHYPLRNLDAVSTSSTAWALVWIAVCASLLGLAALSTARRQAQARRGSQ